MRTSHYLPRLKEVGHQGLPYPVPYRELTGSSPVLRGNWRSLVVLFNLPDPARGLPSVHAANDVHEDIRNYVASARTLAQLPQLRNLHIPPEEDKSLTSGIRCAENSLTCGTRPLIHLLRRLHDENYGGFPHIVSILSHDLEPMDGFQQLKSWTDTRKALLKRSLADRYSDLLEAWQSGIQYRGELIADPSPETLISQCLTDVARNANPPDNVPDNRTAKSNPTADFRRGKAINGLLSFYLGFGKLLEATFDVEAAGPFPQSFSRRNP